MSDLDQRHMDVAPLHVRASELDTAAKYAIYALVTIGFQAEQGISGIGIYLFGLGFTDLLFQKQVGTPLPVRGLRPVDIPLLADHITDNVRRFRAGTALAGVVDTVLGY